jgi:hypothetical protein
MKKELTIQHIERFWSHVLKTPSCWLWKGCKPTEYGYIKLPWMPTNAAHRISYIIANGAIPEGKVVCHKCDVPSCVNPAHLFLGTQSDNVQDMLQKNRQTSPTKGKGRKEYGSYFWREKKTGKSYAVINVRKADGTYTKKCRRVKSEEEAKIVAAQLRKEWESKII